MKPNPLVLGLITAILIGSAIVILAMSFTQDRYDPKPAETKPVTISPKTEIVTQVPADPNVSPPNGRIIVSPSGGIIHCNNGICIDYTNGNIGFEMFP